MSPVVRQNALSGLSINAYVTPVDLVELVLGPLVGLVTESSANILIELNRDMASLVCQIRSTKRPEKKINKKKKMKEIVPVSEFSLINEINAIGEMKSEEEILKEEGVFVHLYGKKTTKPFRKMGHVTIMNESLSKAKEKALFVKNKLKVKSN